MRTPHYLFLAVVLCLAAWRSESESETRAAAVADVPEQRGAIPEGLYFLGGGRTLLLQPRRFVLTSPGEAGPLMFEGDLHAHGGRLQFRSVGLNTECAFQLHEGHLWLGLLRADPGDHVFDDSCDLRFLPTAYAFFRRGLEGRVSWDELKGELIVSSSTTQGIWADGRQQFRRRRDVVLTPWSRDVGPIGLIPAREVNGMGLWRGDSGARIEVSAAATPERGLWKRMEKPKLSQHHWAPDRNGISHETFPLDHMAGHMDSPIQVLWVPLGPDLAVRHVTGGCDSDGRTVPLEYFRRDLSATPSDHPAEPRSSWRTPDRP